MEEFDPQQMIERFSERASAVRKRNLPPVGGDERKAFIEQAEADFFDFSVIADSQIEFSDGILKLTVDMNKPE